MPLSGASVVFVYASDGILYPTLTEAGAVLPVSTAQQTALDLKAPLASPTFTGTVTLPAATVTLAMQANMATASLIYRKTAGTGVPEVNTLATLKTDLVLVKGDVGLGNVDNTADSAKVVASAAVLTTPRNINGVAFNGSADITVTAAGSTLTGSTIAAGMLGTSASTACAGNDSRLSDSRTPLAHAPSHKSGGTDSIKLDELAAPTDITTLDASTTAHGLMMKYPGGTTTFLRADGTFAATSGGGDLALTKMAPTSGVTVTAGYSAYVADFYECVDGVQTEIGDAAILEVG